MAQKKVVDEAVADIQKSIENRIDQNTQRLIRNEIENILLQDFLEALCHKVEQINQVKVISQNSTKNFIKFCCEIPKIDPLDCLSATSSIPHQVIRAIDEVNIEFFFKKETNLHVFNFCSKYFLFSQFDNTRQVNVLNFTWSKNKFDESKICFCFMCKFNLELSEEQKEKEKQQELEKKKDN